MAIWCTLTHGMSAQRLNKGNIMSRLVFDGSTHQLSLLSGDFTVIGTWSAYNNVDSHATIKHVQNGTYSIQDKSTPHYHTPDENGPYGSYGIIRFNVPGHPGIGVHSGRANAKFKPGPQHATMGCIRTTDEAMKSIKESMATSSLSTIEVRNNSGPSAVSSAQRNQTHIYHGIRTQFI